ncbi:MAG: PHP domain-containing protein [Myxococcus sp.]|nr:PHP domain-containing protein [Myxococcus sp.]
MPHRLARLTLLFGTLVVGAAQAQTTVLEGEVPEDGGAFFTVPFTVARGTVELAVRHDDLSSANILDWGLIDARGTFRGWGGGNGEQAVIGRLAASRSYLPGTLPTGQWQVLVGKAQLASRPARYRVEIEARSSPTLSAQDRASYTAAAPLEATARWYAGDLHVHSLESGDARPGLDEIATFTRARGLDFVAVSDHNTSSHYDFISPTQARHPKVLLVPSVEFTTYAGHLNAFGASEFVPFWLGRDGVTLTSALQAFDQQGAIATINHPTLDLGSFCIGCAWQQPVYPSLMRAIEIGVGGWDETGALFDESAIAYWEALADQGVHLTAVGGSDDHRAGVGLNQTQSPIGSPTTLLYATELSVAGLTRALREGRAVVKLRGPDDPFVSLSSLTPLPRAGDTLVGTSAQVLAHVTGGEGATLEWVENGVVVDEVQVTSDPFTHERTFTVPDGRSGRLRAALRIGASPRTVTSHLWLAPDSPPGPPITAAKPSAKGCQGCTSADATLVALLSLLVLTRRRA